MLARAGEKVIVSFPAETWVFPREPTDDASLDSIPIHTPKKFFQAGNARSIILVNEPESLIPAAERWAFFTDFIGEKMGMNIDDHWRYQQNYQAAWACPAPMVEPPR
jgi:hypothetical protein